MHDNFDHVFETWPLEKAFAELLPYTRDYVIAGRLGQLFELEGVLRDYLYFSGRFWDWEYYSVSRERWPGAHVLYA